MVTIYFLDESKLSAETTSIFKEEIDIVSVNLVTATDNGTPKLTILTSDMC